MNRQTLCYEADALARLITFTLESAFSTDRKTKSMPVFLFGDRLSLRSAWTEPAQPRAAHSTRRRRRAGPDDRPGRTGQPSITTRPPVHCSSQGSRMARTADHLHGALCRCRAARHSVQPGPAEAVTAAAPPGRSAPQWHGIDPKHVELLAPALDMSMQRALFGQCYRAT